MHLLSDLFDCSCSTDVSTLIGTVEIVPFGAICDVYAMFAAVGRGTCCCEMYAASQQPTRASVHHAGVECTAHTAEHTQRRYRTFP